MDNIQYNNAQNPSGKQAVNHKIDTDSLFIIKNSFLCVAKWHPQTI